MKRKEQIDRLEGFVHGLVRADAAMPGEVVECLGDPRWFSEGYEMGQLARASLLTAAREQQTREQEPGRGAECECDDPLDCAFWSASAKPDYCKVAQVVERECAPAQEPVEDEWTHEKRIAAERDHYRSEWRREYERAEAAEHERDELRAAIERHRDQLKTTPHSINDVELWAVLSKEKAK